MRGPSSMGNSQLCRMFKSAFFFESSQGVVIFRISENLKTKALLMNPGAVFCWSFVPLAVRFLSSYCPALFQALFRYLAALIVLWSFTLSLYLLYPGLARFRHIE